MEIDASLLLGLWSLLLTLFGAGLGWMVNRVFKMLDDLRAEDDLIKREMNTKHARRDDFHEFRKELLTWMRSIDSKLDNKEDKRDVYRHDG